MDGQMSELELVKIDIYKLNFNYIRIGVLSDDISHRFPEYVGGHSHFTRPLTSAHVPVLQYLSGNLLHNEPAGAIVVVVTGGTVVVVGVTISQRLPVRPGLHLQSGRSSGVAFSLSLQAPSPRQ